SIARDTGLFAAHGVASKANNLPLAFSDDTFMPFDWGNFAFVYDTTRLSSPPASFDELIDSSADLKIAIQDPRTSTPGLGLLLWMKSVYGDQAATKWAALQPKILTVTKGWWDSYSLFLEGEADMVLSYTTSPAYHMIAEGKSNYAAAAFSDGHYAQIEVAAMMKSAPQPELARQFMAFIQSPEFQQVIPTTNWMYPVTKAAVPAEFGSLVTPERQFLYTAEDVAANKSAWVDEWLKASQN
ncbi:MAG: thiamine ABC transporter substrate-binding protein, partial [Candidatus Puniceispirillaceae bacterium]